MLSGSTAISASVSSTASRIVPGSASRSCFARRVSRSSGKPELAPHLVERGETTCLDIPLALAQRLERLFVLQDLERLLECFVLLGREHDRRRPAVPRDHDVLVAGLDLVEQLCPPRPGLPERHHPNPPRQCTGV